MIHCVLRSRRERMANHEMHGRTGVAFVGLLACLPPVPRDFRRYANRGHLWLSNKSALTCFLVLMASIFPLEFVRASDAIVLAQRDFWVNRGSLEFWFFTFTWTFSILVGAILCQLDPFSVRTGERFLAPALVYACMTGIYCAAVLIAYPTLYELCFTRDPLFTDPPSHILGSVNWAGAGRIAIFISVAAFFSFAIMFWIERDWKRALS